MWNVGNGKWGKGETGGETGDMKFSVKNFNTENANQQEGTWRKRCANVGFNFHFR